MIFFIILLYSVLSKLIASNTLLSISHVSIEHQNINLTVWLQIRYPIKSEVDLVNAFRIVDLENKDQVSICISSIDQLILLQFKLQNKIQKTLKIERKSTEYYDWIQIKIYRDTCFYRLESDDAIIQLSECERYFNATLYVEQNILYQVFVYDQEEIENEEIIFQNLFSGYNNYIINTFKDNLQVKFYSKFYTSINEEGILFSLQIVNNYKFLVRYYQDSISIKLRDEETQREVRVFVISQLLDTDQWVLFSISFNQLEITIQYNINNSNNQEKIQLDDFIKFNSQTVIDYMFQTKILLKNTNTFFTKYLQIISLITIMGQNQCYFSCLFCLFNICFDKNKDQLITQISSQIKSSSFYNEQYFDNKHQNCDQTSHFYSRGNCIELPKYRGEYCNNCHILHQQIDLMNENEYFILLLSINKYEYFLSNWDSIPHNQQITSNGLQYEEDLNIFMMKSNDFYRTYQLRNNMYCEVGYTYLENKCRRPLKKCQIQNGNCYICEQQYALFHGKCIKCSKNCLYCKIVSRKSKCLVVEKNYYKNAVGLIKLCNTDSQEFNCLSKQAREQQKQIAQTEAVCQSDQILDFAEGPPRCVNIKYYKNLFQFILSNPIPNSVLDIDTGIEDIILRETVEKDGQLFKLIALQQVSKLCQLVHQYKKNLGYHVMNRKFELLSFMDCSVEDLANKKITFKDVKIYLQDTPIIIYQNRTFSNLIEIYGYFIAQFTIVQFDITFYQLKLKNNIYFNFSLENEIYFDVNFILNISFNFNPTLLYKQNNVFYFKANQIIISNLKFDQVMGFELQLQSESFEPFLNILAKQVVITNIMVQNVKLQSIFELKEITHAVIQNIYIFNSSLRDFISVDSEEEERNSQIFISNIYSNQSSFSQFISIQYSAIHINNIMHEFVKITRFNFYLVGETIEITNIYVFELIQKNSRLFEIDKDSHNNQNTKIYVSKAYFNKIYMNSSCLFHILNTTNTQIDQIYILNVYIEESTIILLMSQNINLSGINLKDVGIPSYYPALQFIIENKTALERFYIFNLSHAESSSFLFLKSYQTSMQRFYFYMINLFRANLLIISAIKLQIESLFFSNMYIKGSNQFIIQIFALVELNISQMKFYKSQFNKVQLMQIHSDYQMCVQQVQFWVILISNFDKDQLILIKGGLDKNIINQIYLHSVNITNYNKIFPIFHFSSKSHITLINLYIISITNLQPQNTIYVIDNKIINLEVHKARIRNMNCINLIKSCSIYLKLKDFKIYNIKRDIDRDYQFIHHTSSPSKHSNESIEINNFQVQLFQGIFLVIDTDIKIQVILHQMSFNHFISIYQVIKIQTISKQRAQLLVANLKLIEQFNNKIDQQQSALLETNFHEVTLQNIYINRIFAILLYIQQGQKISMTDFYIGYYIFHHSIFIFTFEEDDLHLIMNNITILNSKIQRNSVFEMLIFNKIILMIDQIKLKNVTVNFSVFDINFISNQSSIKMSNIMFREVISENILFSSLVPVSYYFISIIGSQARQIFSSNHNQIFFILGIVTDINKSCVLSENSVVHLNQSEIANSDITQYNNLLTSYKSQFQGMGIDLNKSSKILFSLNNGESYFNQSLIEKNIYQIQFNRKNNYLYLPSGRYLQNYKYFNYKTRQYTMLYDSISYVSVFQTKQIECSLKQNWKNQTIQEQQLLIQPGVNQIDNLSVILNPHFKDQFIQLDLVCNQSNQMITYRTLVKTFNCQLGEHLLKDQCVLCDIEENLYSVGYNQQYCLYTDFDIIQQIDIGQIKLHQEYWRHSFANKYIEQCSNQNCLGGWQTGDNSCQIGYVGALCSECDVYNTRGRGHFGKIDNQCTVCYFDYTIFLKGLLLITFQLILIYISYYSNQNQGNQYLFLKITKRRFTEILLRQNVNQVSILLRLFYNYLFTLYLLKDFINFGQIVSLSLNVAYNPTFIAVPQFDCLLNQRIDFPIQFSQLILKVGLPILMINLIVILYTILIKLRKVKYSIYVIITCLLIIHQQSQQIIFQRQQYIIISLLKLLQPIKYSNIWWTLENLSVQYYSKIHKHYLIILVVPLITLLIIFNVIIFLWIKHINKRTIYQQKLPLFMYKQYKGNFYFWEYIRLSFIYLFMMVLYGQDNTIIILLITVFQALTYLNQPFQLKNLNQIDIIILIFSVHTYFSIFINQNGSFTRYIVIILSNLFLIKLYISYFIHSFNVQFRELRIKVCKQVLTSMPYFEVLINAQIYEKNKYYYNLLKQSRKKSNNSITSIASSYVSKQNGYLEVEMTQLNIKL